MIYLAVPLVILLLIGLTMALYILDYAVRSADDLHWLAKVLLLPWLWLGFGLDVALNATLASLAFFEWPHELTLSARVQRHEHDSAGYRFVLATWICECWLRPVDKDHC